ncbi:uncharacterized protein LOC144614638 [Panthera onca]
MWTSLQIIVSSVYYLYGSVHEVHQPPLSVRPNECSECTRNPYERRRILNHKNQVPDPNRWSPRALVKVALEALSFAYCVYSSPIHTMNAQWARPVCLALFYIWEDDVSSLSRLETTIYLVKP